METFFKLRDLRINLFLLALSLLGHINFSFATTNGYSDGLEETKGLLSIQFSWNKEAYGDNTSIEIEYKRKSFLSKAKASGKTALYAKKNEFINLELREGGYELTAIKIHTSEVLSGYYVRVPIEETFIIKPGHVTNGGMIFLVKENKKSKAVMTLKLDNTADLKQYVNIYMPAYEGKLASLEPAWKFIAKDKVDKLIASFADAIVKNENKSPRKNLNYMRTTLGMVFKMKQGADNKITDYELIPTPTYQEIIGMKVLKNGKLLCTLENGSFLYGDDNSLEFMPLPKGLEKVPEIQLIKNDRFLLVDANFNIFSSDASFNWKEQLDHRYEQKSAGLFTIFPSVSYPKIYKGKQHVYIYSPSDDKQLVLLQSSYEDIDFKPIPLSKEVKKVPLVTETPTHLIIGPHLKQSATSKRPGYIYVKEHSGNTWTVRDLPRGDCKRFFAGKDESILYTECSKNNWFESRDFGQSWSKWEASK